MTFLDLFAGIGGFRRGMELAGHNCLGFCEADKYAVMSYTAMHLMDEAQRDRLKEMTLKERQKEVLNGSYRIGEWFSDDVRRLDSDGIPRADCWCFGFPCQDISVAGERKGLEGARSGLFFEIIRILSGLGEQDKPRWLLAENVKNLVSVSRGFDFARVLLELAGLGYSIEWQMLNSKDFGVPQNRQRVFIVGHLGTQGGRKIFPIEGTDGENPAKLTQIADGAGQSQRVYDPNGLSRTLSALGGGQGGKTGLYAIDMSFKDPKITDSIRCLVSTYQKGPVNYSGVRSGVLVGHRVRRLTPRECFRLQGWPDEYFERAQLVNSDAQLYRQAGNGVTVSVVQAIGERMAQIEKEAF